MSMEKKPSRSPIRPSDGNVGRNKLKKIKFVGVEFDYGKYHDGEDSVNDALGKGYVVIDQQPTNSGIVIIMGLYGGGKKL
jgi:hypothetical protein